MNRSLLQMTTLCSVLHLLVDGLCVCCLYLTASLLSVPHLISVFLTYNLLAFLTQPLTGLWADRMERKHWMLLVSVVLLTIAVLTTSIVINFGFSVWGVVGVAVLLGIGNSLFHVWGGKQVVLKTGNDIRALGVFVSTGAFGLALGMVFFSWSLLYVTLLSVCFLSTVYMHLDFMANAAAVDVYRVTDHHFSKLFVVLSLVVLMLVVMLRSLVGESFTGGFSKSSGFVLLIGLLSMLGKMTGGWLARSLGIVRMLVFVVLLAVLCWVFRSQGVMIILIGLFAVNCTMPVTLFLANVVLPQREGLAFGLLAAALIPGYLLAVV